MYRSEERTRIGGELSEKFDFFLKHSALPTSVREDSVLATLLFSSGHCQEGHLLILNHLPSLHRKDIAVGNSDYDPDREPPAPSTGCRVRISTITRTKEQHSSQDDDERGHGTVDSDREQVAGCIYVIGRTHATGPAADCCGRWPVGG